MKMMTTTRMAALLVLTAGLGLTGCAVDATAGSTSELLEAPPADQGLQVTLHAPLERAEETRQCRLVVLPGGEGLDVAAFEHSLSGAARRVRVSHTDLRIADAWAHPDRVPCEELDAFGGQRAYDSTEVDGLVELPEGVAVHFAPNEVILLEADFAASTGAETAEAVGVNLWLASTPPAERAATAVPDGGITQPAE